MGEILLHLCALPVQSPRQRTPDVRIDVLSEINGKSALDCSQNIHGPNCKQARKCKECLSGILGLDAMRSVADRMAMSAVVRVCCC